MPVKSELPYNGKQALYEFYIATDILVHSEVQNMKILIVEDEKTLRNSLIEGLKIKGYTVDSACDGEEADEKGTQISSNDAHQGGSLRF